MLFEYQRVRLEVIQIGNRPYTSHQAMDRFIARINPWPVGHLLQETVVPMKEARARLGHRKSRRIERFFIGDRLYTTREAIERGSK